MRIAAIAALILLSGSISSVVRAADDQVCDVAADLAFGLEDYPTAMMLHRRLLRSQPHNALAHYHLGFAYGMVGASQEELSEYITAAHLGLRNWDLFVNLGLAYFDQHQPTLATKALETAVALGPEHAEAHLNLATVYQSEHRLGEALREVTLARRLAPDDPDAANTNAIICVEMGDIVRAQEIWTQLVQLQPDYAPARANLSTLNHSAARDAQFDRPLDPAGHAARNRALSNRQTTTGTNG